MTESQTAVCVRFDVPTRTGDSATVGADALSTTLGGTSAIATSAKL